MRNLRDFDRFMRMLALRNGQLVSAHALASDLQLSPHTVRTHMQNVLGKLGVHSTLAAVALARRAGVGPVELEPAGAR